LLFELSLRLIFEELLLENISHDSRGFELVDQLAPVDVPLVLFVQQIVNFPHEVMEKDSGVLGGGCEDIDVSIGDLF